MKKQILLAVLSVLSLSLAGCNKPTSTSTPASASVAPSVSESASVSVPQVGELSFTCNVKPLVGTTGYLIASYEGSPLTDQSLVSYTADPATAIALSGNLVQFKEVGKVTITGSYVPEGFTTAATATLELTITDGSISVAVTSIKDALSKATTTAAPIRIQGKVTATYGKGGYIDDGTAAILLYNWYSTATDTAITQQSYGYGLTVGDSVDIYAYIYTYYGMAELSKSYQESAGKYVDLEGAYVKKIDKTITPTAVHTVTETDLATITSANSGQMYSFDATYVSGTIGSTSGTKYQVDFKVGTKTVSFFTDKKEADQTTLYNSFTAMRLVANDPVHIVAPFNQVYSSTGALDFSWFSHGTTVTRLTPIPNDPATSVTVSAPNGITSVTVGDTLPLTATTLPATADPKATFASSDTTLATVDASTGVVTGVKAGAVTITATSADGGKTGTFALIVVAGVMASQKLDSSTLATTTFFTLGTGVVINASYATEIDIPASSTVATKGISDITRVVIDVYGSYDNLKIYSGTDATGTELTHAAAVADASTKGLNYTYYAPTVSSIFINNPSTHTVDVFSIEVFYNSLA